MHYLQIHIKQTRNSLGVEELLLKILWYELYDTQK